MKRIQIVETDSEYRKGLAAILMNDGAVPFVFEVPDEFDVNSYEGLADYASTSESVQSFSSSFPEVVAWLENYRGNFDFYLSLQAQFRQKGMLSEKQLACVQRAIEKDKAAGLATPQGVQREYDLKPGTFLFLSKFISTKIAKQAGHTRAHRVVEVIEVEGETEKAYRAKVKLSARRTSHCGVCGLSLENPASVAAGIGPICAENNGVSFGEASLSELEKLLEVTVAVTTWIPKASIKERINPNAS